MKPWIMAMALIAVTGCATLPDHAAWTVDERQFSAALVEMKWCAHCPGSLPFQLVYASPPTMMLVEADVGACLNGEAVVGDGETGDLVIVKVPGDGGEAARVNADTGFIRFRSCDSKGRTRGRFEAHFPDGSRVAGTFDRTPVRDDGWD